MRLETVVTDDEADEHGPGHGVDTMRSPSMGKTTNDGAFPSSTPGAREPRVETRPHHSLLRRRLAYNNFIFFFCTFVFDCVLFLLLDVGTPADRYSP